MNTARFLEYVWPFFTIMNERVKEVIAISQPYTFFGALTNNIVISDTQKMKNL